MIHRNLVAAATLASTFAVIGCSDRPDETSAAPTAQQAPVVEVTAVHDHAANRHLFQVSETELQPGWTTFRFSNASPVDHFFLIWRYPDEGLAAAKAAGQTPLEHWHQGVALSFDGMDTYVNGEIDFDTYFEGLVARLQADAPWVLDPGLTPAGGPGLTGAGAISKTTVRLEPGDYIAECYVRDENGVFHSAVGMLAHLVVDGEPTGAEPPEATARLTLSSTDGMQVDRPLEAGEHVIAVEFIDRPVYANLGGPNAQLARVQRDAPLENLAAWMDWRNKQGLVNRAPDSAHFLGGAMDMPAGSTAYFHVTLEPGDYAWIAEIPDPADHGMLRTFTVD